MMIAHIPAGYLATRRLLDARAMDGRSLRLLIALGLFASVFPDIDLLYFYLIDNRRTLHHEYWTHIPAFWAVLALGTFALCRLARFRLPLLPFAVFFANIFLHMILDTVAGGILWLYPWDSTSFVLVEVPSRFGWWLWNFILHWSFLFELAILAWFAFRLHRDGVADYLRNRLRVIAPGRILRVRSGTDRERP